ncbi:MAG TPA: RAMP superfamily CRISPR-associated protein [Candidatus Brocadiaceae bacterium]|nr:RAMP superfamily CRISPR-associated protein [Candidatus Brocadiaceae bacterium]
MGKILTYRVTLTAPLLLTAPGGDPNSADTHRYISGSAIRGALAAEYLRKYPKKDAAVDDEFRKLFLSGDVRFLNAYPNPQSDKIPHNTCLFPAPESLKIEKGLPAKVFDLASKDHKEVYRNGDSNLPRPLKGLPGEFVFLSGPTVFYYNPATAVRLHNQRERKAGHPVEGNIFSYTALQPGERFIGNMLMEEDTHLTLLKAIVPTLKYLGRSRRTEYGGGVIVEIVTEQDDTKWGETEKGNTSGDIGNKQWVITLLSDYIANDETGQSTIDGFITELNDNGIQYDTSRDRCFVSYGIQGGYPGVWHLPYPQARSIAAGSVFVIRAAAPLTAQKVKELEWKGMGSRRVEGFGRIRCNWHGEKMIFDHSEEIDNTPVMPAQHGNDDEADGMLELMRAQILEAALNRELSKKINSLLNEIFKVGTRSSVSPHASLLGRLRAMIRTAKESETIIKWLDNCKDKKAGKALKTITVDNTRFPEWIEKLIKAPTQDADHKIWNELNARDLCKGKALLDEGAKSASMLDDPRFVWKYQQRMLESLLSGIIDRMKKEEQNG